jgi:hypothetical protein
LNGFGSANADNVTDRERLQRHSEIATCNWPMFLSTGDVCGESRGGKQRKLADGC